METEIGEKRVLFKNKIIDLNKICRLCIKESSPLYCVEGKINDEDWKIAQVISICYKIVVEDGKKICEECLIKLDMIYNVMTEVLRNNKDYDLHLRRFDSVKKDCNKNTEVFVEVKLEDTVPDNNESIKDEVETELENPNDIKSENEDIAAEKEIESCSSPGVEEKETFNEPKKNPSKYKKRNGKKPDRKREICRVCGIKVKSLDDHFVDHYEIKLECDHCPGLAFKTLLDLNNHLEIHSCSLKTRCNYCYRRFYLEGAKLHHFGEHNREEIEAAKQRKKPRIINAPCTHCGKVFATQNLLKSHEKRLHRPDLGVFCQICNKRCLTKTLLKEHMRYHLNEKPFICEYCGKGFRTNIHCKAHIRVHTNELPYHCNDCNRDFRSTSWLNRHKTAKGCAPENAKKFKLRSKTDNDSIEKPMNCSLCTDTFDEAAMYQAHVEEKHPSECYKCGYCEEKLERFDEYQIHQKTEHSNSKENMDEVEFYLPCPHCNKVCHDKKKFIAHLYYVQKQKQSIAHKCTDCEKEFSFRANLERHITVVHLKQREHECDICNKTFGQIGSMRTHRRTHTGEKPFSCKICNCSYGDYSTLFKHNKKHHA